MALAIPLQLYLCELFVGVINGIGVAFLTYSSMIFTLGVNAVVQGVLCSLYTAGGFAPQDRATALMHWLAVGAVFGVPSAALVWLLLLFVRIFFRPASGLHAAGPLYLRDWKPRARNLSLLPGV